MEGSGTFTGTLKLLLNFVGRPLGVLLPYSCPSWDR